MLAGSVTCVPFLFVFCLVRGIGDGGAMGEIHTISLAEVGLRSRRMTAHASAHVSAALLHAQIRTAQELI